MAEDIARTEVYVGGQRNFFEGGAVLECSTTLDVDAAFSPCDGLQRLAPAETVFFQRPQTGGELYGGQSRSSESTRADHSQLFGQSDGSQGVVIAESGTQNLLYGVGQLHAFQRVAIIEAVIGNRSHFGVDGDARQLRAALECAVADVCDRVGVTFSVNDRGWDGGVVRDFFICVNEHHGRVRSAVCDAIVELADGELASVEGGDVVGQGVPSVGSLVVIDTETGYVDVTAESAQGILSQGGRRDRA